MKTIQLLFLLSVSALVSMKKGEVIIRDPFDCIPEQSKNGLRLFREFIWPHLPAARSLKTKVLQCTNQLYLGQKKIYKLLLDIDGDRCEFTFDVIPGKEYNKKPLINKDPAIMKEQADRCKITPVDPKAKHPGISEEGRKACQGEESEIALRNFVAYVDLPSITHDYYTVLECWKQDTPKGIISTISLKDKNGKGVLASMFFPRHVTTPDVLTKPDNYIKGITYAFEHPKHPGLVMEEKVPCNPSMRGQYLQDFVDYIGAESLKSSDLTMLSCTVQAHEGRIVNMDIIDDAGLSAFVSMYYPPHKGVSDVISDVPGLIESMRGLDKESDVVETTYEHYEEYQETVSYESFFVAHNKEKEALISNWQDISEGECKRYLEQFEVSIGVEKGHFKGLQIQDCKTQVLGDINVQFTLTGDSDKLLGASEIKVLGLIPRGGKNDAIFSSAPETFIEQLQEQKGISKPCQPADKKKFAHGYKSLASALTLSDQVLFTENIKSCVKVGKQMNMELSFNGRACAIFAARNGDNFEITETSCPVKEVML